MQKLSEYVMTAEAAEILGVSQNTLRGWARDGKIPVRKNPANGYRLFRRSDLKRFLREAAKPLPANISARADEYVPVPGFEYTEGDNGIGGCALPLGNGSAVEIITGKAEKEHELGVEQGKFQQASLAGFATVHQRSHDGPVGI